MKPITFLIAAALSLGATVLTAADNPTVIRIGVPSIGNDGYSPITTGNVGTVAGLGLLEDEFRKDGIRIEWTYFKGAGPALNESLANGLQDFAAGHGDLPTIVHRAGGLQTRILLAVGRRQNTYVLVPSDSSIRNIQDLKGKRVAQAKGTNGQLAWAKILADNNLAEKDLRIINMDAPTARAAILTKDVDAYVGGNDTFQLRNRGVGRIIYTTVGQRPYLNRYTTLLVTEEFEHQHPDLVQRVVNQFVKGAAWSSDETRRVEIFKLWAKNGQGYADFKEDFGNDTLASHQSPLLDEFFYNHYRKAIQASLDFKLIRKSFDLDSWVEPKYLAQALKDQHLEGFWPEYDAEGQIKKPGTGVVTPAPATAQAQ